MRRKRDSNPHRLSPGSFQDCCHTIRRFLRIQKALKNCVVYAAQHRHNFGRQIYKKSCKGKEMTKVLIQLRVLWKHRDDRIITAFFAQDAAPHSFRIFFKNRVSVSRK